MLLRNGMWHVPSHYLMLFPQVRVRCCLIVLETYGNSILFVRCAFHDTHGTARIDQSVSLHIQSKKTTGSMCQTCAGPQTHQLINNLTWIFKAFHIHNVILQLNIAQPPPTALSSICTCLSLLEESPPLITYLTLVPC